MTPAWRQCGPVLSLMNGHLGRRVISLKDNCPGLPQGSMHRHRELQVLHVCADWAGALRQDGLDHRAVGMGLPKQGPAGQELLAFLPHSSQVSHIAFTSSWSQAFTVQCKLAPLKAVQEHHSCGAVYAHRLSLACVVQGDVLWAPVPCRQCAEEGFGQALFQPFLQSHTLRQDAGRPPQGMAMCATVKTRMQLRMVRCWNNLQHRNGDSNKCKLPTSAVCTEVTRHIV